MLDWIPSDFITEEQNHLCVLCSCRELLRELPALAWSQETVAGRGLGHRVQITFGPGPDLLPQQLWPPPLHSALHSAVTADTQTPPLHLCIPAAASPGLLL